MPFDRQTSSSCAKLEGPKASESRLLQLLMGKTLAHTREDKQQQKVKSIKDFTALTQQLF